MNTANETILSTIKDLRHMLALQCERLREAGEESEEMNKARDVAVSLERYFTIINDEVNDANP